MPGYFASSAFWGCVMASYILHGLCPEMIFLWRFFFSMNKFSAAFGHRAEAVYVLAWHS